MFQDYIFEILRQAHLNSQAIEYYTLDAPATRWGVKKRLNCGCKTNMNATSNDLYRSGTVY